VPFPCLFVLGKGEQLRDRLVERCEQPEAQLRTLGGISCLCRSECRLPLKLSIAAPTLIQDDIQAPP
jgi:hypothetical protein